MSNPNRTPFSANKDDDDGEEYTPFSSKPAKKPVTVNNNLINLSLNTEKEQEAHRAQEKSESTEKSPAEVKEDKESDTSPSVSKRRRVGGSLRKLLKTKLFSRDKPPETPEITQPIKPDLTAATGAATAANIQAVPKKSEAGLPEIPPAEKPAKAAETTQHEAEVKKPAAEIAPDTAKAVAPAANTAPASANIAPSTPNAAPANPAPPRPPRRPRFGARASGGGNIPPVPTAVQAANFTPAAPSPSGYNQAPVIVDRRNNSGPAWIAFLAATYFRRRGEKRINRKIEKTNDEVKQTQEELAAEKRARRAEKTAQLPNSNRPDAAPVPAAAVQNTTEVRYLNGVEQQPDPVSAPPETIIHTENRSEALSKPVKAAEVFAASPLAREIADRETAQKEIKKQAELAKAAEKEQAQPVNEKTFDRRHEIKDSSGSQPRMAAGTTPITKKPTSGIQGPASCFLTNSPVRAPDNSSQRDKITAPPAKQAPDLYKQSMQAGFALGLSVVVLGAIAFIILK